MTSVLSPDALEQLRSGARDLSDLVVAIMREAGPLPRTTAPAPAPPAPAPRDEGPRTTFGQRGVYWFRYGDGLEALVIADRDGARRVIARFVLADASHRWSVDAVARALLDAYDPPRGRGTGDGAQGLWAFEDGDFDGRRFGLSVLAKLTRAGALVVEGSACGSALGAATLAVRELRIRLGADTPTRGYWPRDLAGCHVEKIARGLVLLGDHVDGRRRYHARRRAAREGLTPTGRPELRVIRTTVPRTMAPVVARRPRPGGDAA